MAEPVYCCAHVWRNSWKFSCSRRASVERDGKWYCWIHDPVAREEKQKAHRAKWARNDAIRAADRDIANARDRVITAAIIATAHSTGGQLAEAVLALDQAEQKRKELNDPAAVEAQAHEGLGST